MGFVCQLVFQPVIKVIQVTVSVTEFILVQTCRLIQEFVHVTTDVLENVCNSVVHTVCSAVCSVICDVCDFFCGIFGCDCGCENVCDSVCNVVTDVVCGPTWILKTVLQAVTTLVCDYILKAVLAVLNLIGTIVTMVLTWVCSLIDTIIRWFVCWVYVAEIFNNTEPRRLRVAPKIVRNANGHSDWFVYVNSPNADGNVDQNTQGYILSDKGKPLLPLVDSVSRDIVYYEVATRGNVITGDLRKQDGKEGAYVPGQPFLYYAYKVIEIASHLLGDIFATDPADDGRGTDYHKNLLTYNANVQDWLAGDGQVLGNNYNNWSDKYKNKSSKAYFGDTSISDMGIRVDTDATCSHPTNTFIHLVKGEIAFTAPDTDIAENMTCGPSQTLTFDQTNFLMSNKDGDSSAITTYFVSKYDANDSDIGCNDLLGYTVVTFEGSDQPLFVRMKVLPLEADTNEMMARVVENIHVAEIISGKLRSIVRVAENYLHECSHQCGLLHDTDAPDCENDTTLHIANVMNPGAFVRRAYTRIEWCMVRGSSYISSRSLQPFLQAAELPDSDTVPPPPPK